MRYVICLLLITTPALAVEPALAIRNATVESMAAAGRIEKASIVIRNGKIEAAGKDISIPDDAKVIDARGGTVMPGIIDPYYEIAVGPIQADSGSRTVVIGGRTITIPGGGAGRTNVFTRMADNFYPHDSRFKQLPRLGFTRLNLVSGGSGQSAVVRLNVLDSGRMLDRPDGVAFAAATNQTESLDQIRTRLEQAKRGVNSATMGQSMRAQAGGQLWMDVHEGKAPLIVNASSSASIVHLLRAVEPFKNVKLTIFASGGAFAETVESLKGRNIRCLVHPNIEMLPNSRDRFAPARLLHENGIEFAFTLHGKPQAAAADEGLVQQDFPLFSVAMMVKAGLPRNVALAALTRQPATMIGIDATHGSVESGKAADLLLYTGDPLDPASRLRLAIIDGRTCYAND